MSCVTGLNIKSVSAPSSSSSSVLPRRRLLPKSSKRSRQLNKNVGNRYSNSSDNCLIASEGGCWSSLLACLHSFEPLLILSDQDQSEIPNDDDNPLRTHDDSLLRMKDLQLIRNTLRSIEEEEEDPVGWQSPLIDRKPRSKAFSPSRKPNKTSLLPSPSQRKPKLSVRFDKENDIYNHQLLPSEKMTTNDVKKEQVVDFPVSGQRQPEIQTEIRAEESETRQQQLSALRNSLRNAADKEIAALKADLDLAAVERNREDFELSFSCSVRNITQRVFGEKNSFTVPLSDYDNKIQHILEV